MFQLGSLIYRSHPAAPPWPATILDIARVAERRNSACAITGMLLFAADCYLQYAEGPAPALDALWRDLARDRRHGILWVRRDDGGPRRLPRLSMGYADADRESGFAAAARLWHLRHDWPRSEAQGLTEMLVGIAREKYPSLTAP